jgi:hypothetical protein
MRMAKWVQKIRIRRQKKRDENARQSEVTYMGQTKSDIEVGGRSFIEGQGQKSGTAKNISLLKFKLSSAHCHACGG